MNYDDLTDAELVARCRDRHEAAWSTLVRRYQRLLYTIPRRARLSEAQAADVFQVCFEQLYRNLDKLADPSRVRAWLVTTARRETLRLLDQARGQVDWAAGAGSEDDEANPIEAIADPSPLPEEQLADLQEHDRLRRAMDRLDPRSRRMIELLFLQDETPPYSQIAATLGIAEGSIGPTRARCLAKLREALDAL